MVVRFWSALLAATGLWLLATGSARALDFTVRNCANDNELRLAVQQIALDPDGGTLTFDCGSAPVTILLDATEGALPMILSSAVVDGGGLVTLSGGGESRIFTVGTEGSLTLKNLRIIDGFPGPRDGGAIASLGTLVVQNVVFEGNRAPETHSGGAIVSYGPLHITSSRFVGNDAGGGGALYVRFQGGASTIADTLFADNHAAGTFHGEAGAIQVGADARLAISRSTLQRNNALMGGALYVDSGAVLTITNSTLHANEAALGGALYIDTGDSAPKVLIHSSTLTGNRAVTSGGALAAADGEITLANTILGENGSGANCSLLPPEPVLVSAGGNLTDDASCGLNTATDRTTDALGLAPLGLGAGLTPVRLPLPGSPALDGGACHTSIATDQRGVTRPQGPNCDVGAVELRYLTIAASISGSGAIRSQTPQYACTGQCTNAFPEGTQLTLQAQPAAGYTFAGWSGACAGMGACALVLESNVTLSALFEKAPPTETPAPTFALAVRRIGDGLVISDPPGIVCGATCRHTFSAGQQVRLTAEPAQGASFGGWGPACSGTDSCTITMTAPLTVTATFLADLPTGTPEWRAYLPAVSR